MDDNEDKGSMSNEEKLAKRNVSKAKTEFYKKHSLGPASSSHLEDCLLGLLDPRTTPEKALESLSSPLFSSGAYRSDKLANMMENNESIEVVIFLAYTRFMIKRLPEANVDGVWEDMLFKTIRLSQNFSANEAEVSDFASHTDSEIFRCSTFNKIIPTRGIRVGTWFDKALSSPSKCTNPYIRLELFRLIRLFRISGIINLKCTTITFIHTICEIQPHHLYPSGNSDDLLFSIRDMYYSMSCCCVRLKLQKIISTDLINQLKENNQVMDNSNEAKFLSNCIKIVVVFASIACCKPDRNEKYIDLKNCIIVLRERIGSLVAFEEYRPMMSNNPKSIWMEFRYIIMQPPFRSHIIETIRNLTKAIINHKCGNAKSVLIYLRDMITEDLSVYDMSGALPGLLLSRQINGPTRVHQYSLQVSRINHIYKKNSNEDSELNNSSSDTIILSPMSWSLVCRALPIDDCDSSNSHDNRDNSYLFSSSSDSFFSSSDDSSI